ncbi:tRNA wybutosine-synthesizing protein 2 [Madurella mycetomatis]|uniref:tRNA wybutosine-synthesizing protein 2 n=1 Tax=Madurella mycetomatis TaxID=100816 RepID=A0A175WFN6_9PEZI|nr:tRNA wybutosine-synthesizing protein 2 [Madurella mycetomatis]
MSRSRKRKENPICAAISTWLGSLPSSIIDSIATHDIKQLIDRAPKRWVVYEPMVLLPSGSFTTAPWPALLASLDPAQKDSLWTAILSELSPATKPALTHLAINEGIPLHLSDSSSPFSSKPGEAEGERGGGEEENLFRSPTGLHLLHGSFGAPFPTATTKPTPSDFQSALWVSTKQNGIYQTWAPRHTMFSRGNIKEKARLLSFHPSRTRAGDDRYAVDLYAGIGYFAFPFAALGLRVLCWEVNPWSAEGLRRGAAANGWSVRVVEGLPGGGAEGADADVAGILRGGEQIVVFLENNRHARERIAAARRAHGLEVLHVNCGFLPSSKGVWRDAWEIAVGPEGGRERWLHLHENIGAEEVEERKGEVQRLFGEWVGQGGVDRKTEARVEHVELVKTFAPGVWHCVFDVMITSFSGDVE